MPTTQQYQEYLKAVANPDSIKKLARLDFLNDDGSIAFTIDNQYHRGYGGYGSMSRAFLQEGTLNVSLQNGTRRQADIRLENLDGAFDYNVNKIWAGQQVRLMMGVELSDGYEYYIPQGVFYFDNPIISVHPTGREAQYSLTDKWAYLDGTLFGNLRDTYVVPRGSNIFAAMQAVLNISKYTLENTYNTTAMIDNIPPLFSTYFNTRTTTTNGEVVTNNIVPYDVTVEYGRSFADVLLSLNDLVAGWIGYDQTGRLTLIPSENDIDDRKKPILWDFTMNDKTFLDFEETSNIGEVYNEFTVVGEALDSNIAPIGRAINNDATSDTSIGRIGRKSYVESASGYYTKEQCAALAAFRLKRATVLQKSIAITSSQIFHLQENCLVTVQRRDKVGSPIERHIIQSYSLPISQTDSMTINATSVADYPNATIEEVDYGITV